MASAPCTFPFRLTWNFTSARPKERSGRAKDTSCFAIAISPLPCSPQLTDRGWEAGGVLYSLLLGTFFSVKLGV